MNKTQTCALCHGMYSFPDSVDDKVNGACPHCGKTIYTRSGSPCGTGLLAGAESVGDFSDLEAKQKRKEYKVLTQKDKWFSGKFDPNLLEKALNEYAKHGWYVVSCATADVSGNRQEIVIILERTV